MKKLMEPVSRLDVIKAFMFMCDPHNIKVIHIPDDQWSKDNSSQIDIITKSVTFCRVKTCKIDSREGLKVFPSGYYVCAYHEKLNYCEYSIKVIYQLHGVTNTAYLYYIGQDVH